MSANQFSYFWELHPRSRTSIRYTSLPVSVQGMSSVVRVVQYESAAAHKASQQDEALQQQVALLRNFVDSATARLYEEIRTTGDFK